MSESANISPRRLLFWRRATKSDATTPRPEPDEGVAHDTAHWAQCDSDDQLGLSEAEAEQRRALGQGNHVKTETSRTYEQIIRDNLFTFINTTLIGIGIVLVVLGQPKDAILTSSLAVINALIGTILEVRAKRRLDHIALIARTKARVIRDGRERDADPDELVVGDVLVVHPGDQILVDGRLIACGMIEVDESALTGEADFIEKRPGDPVYSGSYCMSGDATYVAEKVGANSLAAGITAGARAYAATLTPLQRDVNKVVRILLVVAGFYLSMVIVDSVIWHIRSRDTVLAAAVVLGIAPPGLFLLITVTYSMAALRLANQHALVQEINAVESLSYVNIFCMDKTGTLTANRLRLETLLPIDVDEVSLKSILGAFTGSVSGGTKTSEAIAASLSATAVPLIDEIPFSSDRKWSAVSADVPDFRGVFALGAAESLELYLVDGPAEPPAGWAERGLRVLLFARAPKPAALHDETGTPMLPRLLKPIGWLALSDELRPHAVETLRSLEEAGVAVKIISGDYPETVAALARQAGLSPDAKLVSGLELDRMDDEAFSRSASEATIFGRTTPHQKERLVQTLRDQGHYVAATGDGVNDVLSLKKANLGIAMQSGSQATRAAADIVLLQDSFEAVPIAFTEGQRIRRGLQGTLYLFLTRVFTVALVILMVAVVQGGFPFSPGHMSLLTILTVGIPTFGLVLFTRPGAAPTHMFRCVLHFVLPAGTLLTLAAFGVYTLAYFRHDIRIEQLPAGGVVAETAVPASALLARDSLTYILVLGGLWLVVFAAPPIRWFAVIEETTGDWRPTILAIAMLGLYAVIVSVEALRNFFGVRPIPAWDYVSITAIVLGWVVILRYAWLTRAFERFFGYGQAT